jgi:UDP-2,3-diacylglucosamine hydrolase
LFSLNEKKVAISHGDKYDAGLFYNIYSKLLRNKITLSFLKPLERVIIVKSMKSLSEKKICHSVKNFEKKVKKILRHYKNADLVIEGHFHQSKIFDKYISLPSQACHKTVAIVENSKVVFRQL